MEKLMDVASYVYNRYFEEYGKKIDEIKMHKLLYFAQRESFAISNEPLFYECFYGWKYGPILKEIRNAYKNDSFYKTDVNLSKRLATIMDKIFKNYSNKESLSLSRITHGEISWIKSRIGVSKYADSDNRINNEDIREDAIRYKKRENMLKNFGFIE